MKVRYYGARLHYLFLVEMNSLLGEKIHSKDFSRRAYEEFFKSDFNIIVVGGDN